MVEEQEKIVLEFPGPVPVGKLYVEERRALWRLHSVAAGRVEVPAGAKVRFRPNHVFMKRVPTLAQFRPGPISFLDLSGLRVTSELLRGGQGLEGLEILSLADADIGDDLARELGEFTNLKALDLHGTSVTGKTLQMLGTIKGLRSLILTGCFLSDGDLESLSELQELEVLRLGGTQITDNGLESISNLRKLKDLELPTGVGDEGIAIISSLTNLQALEISDTLATDDAMAYVAGLPHLAHIGIPEAVGGCGLHALAPLENLRSIRMDRSFLPVEVAAGLLQASRLTSLQTRSRFESDAAALLANHPRLERVALLSDHLSPAAIRSLAPAPRLAHLILASRQITDSDIYLFHEFKKLRSVRFLDSGLGMKAFDQLCGLFPNVRFTHDAATIDLVEVPCTGEVYWRHDWKEDWHRLFPDRERKMHLPLQGDLSYRNDGSPLDDLEALSSCPRVRFVEIRLRNCHLTTRDIALLAGLRGVMTLEMILCRFEAGALERFAGAKGVRRIILDGARGISGHLEGLAKIESLAELSVQTCALADMDLAALSGFRHLRWVDLQGNPLSAEAMKDFHRRLPDVEVVFGDQ